MRNRVTLLTVICVGLVATFAYARPQPNPQLQAIDDSLPGDLINNPLTMNWEGYGETAKRREVPAPETPGQYAVRTVVSRAGPEIYSSGMNVPLTGPIQSGDMIVIASWARCVKPPSPDQPCVMGMRLQRNEAPYPGFGDRRVVLTSEWKLYEIRLQADKDIPLQNGVLSLQMSAYKQTVDVGQTFVLNLGR